MSTAPLNISLAVKEAFDSFIRNDQTLAQPFTLEKNVVHTRPIVRREGPQDSFQSKLNLLDDVLDPKIPLYLLLRRRDSIFAITFVPYRAFKDENEMYLRYRHELVQLLGDEHIKTSLICKEVGEITDARSWVERETRQQEKEVDECTDGCEDSHEHTHTKDAGYKKNKCRLCDRRMKNKITDQALEALGKLGNVGNLVQVSLDSNLVLALDLHTSGLPPEQVSSRLPTTHPTFTFYRHKNKLLYFIFHSPDTATVQQRMKHTMAIPGLVNVHAEDCRVHVDQKIEIHEPEDLVFNEGDEKVGRFRSVYLRGGWQGTESQYEGSERDKKFYDALS